MSTSKSDWRDLKSEFQKTYPNHDIEQLYMQKLNTKPSMVENGAPDGASLFNFSAHPYLMTLMLIIALQKGEALANEIKAVFEEEAVKPRSGNGKKFTPDFEKIYADIVLVLDEANLPSSADLQPPAPDNDHDGGPTFAAA